MVVEQAAQAAHAPFENIGTFLLHLEAWSPQTVALTWDLRNQTPNQLSHPFLAT